MTRRANQFGLICYPPPGQLLERATLRGNERTWPIGDIPGVTEAAKQNDLSASGVSCSFAFPMEEHASAANLRFNFQRQFSAEGTRVWIEDGFSQQQRH